MILEAFEGNPYRMLTPKWAMAPTSGEGAALHGGRANRVGLPALYLSLETQTAILEYKQTSSLLPAGTLVQYDVRLSRVADFREGYSPRWDPIWEDFVCDWRELWFNQHVEPPSWAAADLAIESGAQGILFRSQVDPAGTNLVVFTAAVTAADQLQALDPGQLLPRDQSSWR